MNATSETVRIACQGFQVTGAGRAIPASVEEDPDICLFLLVRPRLLTSPFHEARVRLHADDMSDRAIVEMFELVRCA